MLDAALRQVEDLTAFLRSYMSNLSAHGRVRCHSLTLLYHRSDLHAPECVHPDA